MEDVAAAAPRDREAGVVRVVDDALRGLVLDAGLVQVVAADRARVRQHVPRPHRHRVPLLDAEPARIAAERGLMRAGGRAQNRVLMDGLPQQGLGFQARLDAQSKVLHLELEQLADGGSGRLRSAVVF